MALCISQRHSLRTIRSTRSNEPTKERHPKNKKTHQRNTSWMRCHQMPSSVSIAKSGLNYRIRRHCMERSFLFWLPRSTPSTSVQSILDFRPPQTICHAYSRLPAGFNGSGMRLPTKAQAVDIVRFGWCEMFSSRSYRRRTAFRSYQQSTSHRPHKLPCRC